MRQRVCYNTHESKRRDFAARTVPMLRQAARDAASNEHEALGRWMADAGVLAKREPLAVLEALHEAARAGRYTETKPGHCDVLQPVAHTLEHGGDCDQWAVVLLACCLMLGFAPYLVSFGDQPGADPYADPARHVAVICEIGDRSVLLDPKGSQEGADFNEWPDMPLTAGWPL